MVVEDGDDTRKTPQINMKASMYQTKSMDTEHSHGLLEISTKEIIRTMNEKVKEK
jgi:hypothetical protein